MRLNDHKLTETQIIALSKAVAMGIKKYNEDENEFQEKLNPRIIHYRDELKTIQRWMIMEG